jgi:epoxyqueuosine reductase
MGPAGRNARPPLSAPATRHCGSCTACIDVCPTQAIVGPYELDARRCISYLTIEHRGDIPDTLQPDIGSHVYGCDVCQEVCPWNAIAPVSDDAAWQPRPAWDRVDLTTLASREDDELARALRGSAMRRTKVQGLRRNIRVALDNAQNTN